MWVSWNFHSVLKFTKKKKIHTAHFLNITTSHFGILQYVALAYLHLTSLCIHHIIDDCEIMKNI